MWATIPNAGPSPYQYKGAPVPGLNYMGGQTGPWGSAPSAGSLPGMPSAPKGPAAPITGWKAGVLGQPTPITAQPQTLQDWVAKANQMLPQGTQASYGIGTQGPSELIKREYLASMPSIPNAAGKQYIMPHMSQPGAQAINPEREQDYVWDKVRIGGKKGFGWGLMNLAGAGLGTTGAGSFLASRFLPAAATKALPYIGGANTLLGAIRGKGRNIPGAMIGGVGLLG